MRPLSPSFWRRRRIGCSAISRPSALTPRISGGPNVNQWARRLRRKIIGSSGRIRTYNPSVNSRTGCSRLALQTRGSTRLKFRFTVNLGGLWGYCRHPSKFRNRFTEATSGTANLLRPSIGRCQERPSSGGEHHLAMQVRSPRSCSNTQAPSPRRLARWSRRT
jgi:hypothetical protein